MKTNQLKYIVTVIVFAIIGTLLSCKKHGTPPIKSAVTGPSITIQQLRSAYVGMNTKFTSNTLLNVVVTADEASGNLYKQVYVRDNSGTIPQTNYYGAISLHFIRTGTVGLLSVGDSVAINLNGATLAKSTGGSLEIDSLDPSTCITKLKTGLNPLPLAATIPQLYTYTGGQFIYDAQLVKLSNVEFIAPNVGTTYAVAQQAPAAPQNVNKFLCDSFGNTIIAYNSGYANFASTVIPNKSGTLTAVANLYTTMQLSIRSFPDINLSNNYNPIVYDTITQNFSYEALASKGTIMAAGWKSMAYQGSLNWQGAQYSVAPNWKYSPAASNYKTTDIRNDIWLVSPPISDYAYSHGGSITKYMDFSSALQYGTTKRLLSVMVSRTYDGTNLIPSQWTDISGFYPSIAAISSNGYPSFKYAHGNNSPYSPIPIALTVGTAGSTPTFYVAFRYQSNTNDVDSTGSTYLLGTFVLRNN
ncbi:MAG: DUF5689 domain-containing protein [Bacteroidia bacterium]